MNFSNQSVRKQLVDLLRLVNTFLAITEKKESEAAEKAYLQTVVQKLTDAISALDEEEDSSKEVQQEILKVLQTCLDFEVEAREKLNIGARFQVIHGQLENLLKKYLQIISEVTDAIPKVILSKEDIGLDEEVVYVYLYSAQGKRLGSWLSLLTPKSLQDLSVNRPVYAKEAHIQELLRSKLDPDQHAYIKVVVKKADILMSYENSVLKDGIGNLLLRIKHGALVPERIINFCHKNRKYLLTEDEGLVLVPG